MDILDLLASDNYIPYNRTLAKEIGVEAAILFGALCGYQRHYKLQEFFREQANIIEDTCLTEYAIRQATKVLQQKGLIIVNKKGLPAKNYYRINTSKLLEYLSTSGCENDTTGYCEINSTSGCENDTTRDSENNSTNNKINNKTNNKINNKDIDIKEIFDYWNNKNIIQHRDLKPSIIKQIDKSLKEFTKDDICTFIDRYSQVINDKNYFFNTKWTLEEFLKQNNAIKDFTDEGSKWVNYNSQKTSKNSNQNNNIIQHNYNSEQFDNIYANIDEIKF